MACHKFGKAKVGGWICCPNIYKFPYNGSEYYFEWHNYMGPVSVKKHGLEPRSTVPVGFYDAISEFCAMPEGKRKQYLISD